MKNIIEKIKQYKNHLIIGLAILIAFGIGLSLSSTHTVIVEKEVIKTVEKNVGVTQTQYDASQNALANQISKTKQCQLAASELAYIYAQLLAITTDLANGDLVGANNKLNSSTNSKSALDQASICAKS